MNVTLLPDELRDAEELPTMLLGAGYSPRCDGGCGRRPVGLLLSLALCAHCAPTGEVAQ